MTATVIHTNNITKTPDLTLTYNLTITHSPSSSSTSTPTFTVNEITITDHSTNSTTFTLSPSLTHSFSTTNPQELATKLTTHSISLSQSQSPYDLVTPTSNFTKIVKKSLNLDCQILIKEKVPAEYQSQITTLIHDVKKPQGYPMFQKPQIKHLER